MVGQRMRQCLHVFERKPRSRADRKMGGTQRIANQHPIADGPSRVADHREPAPQRLVGHQPGAFELLRKDILAVRAGLVFRHALEAHSLESAGIHLHQEGAHRGRIAIVVRVEAALCALLERLRQVVEGARCAEPREPVVQESDLRAELRFMRLANQGVRPVGADHQVGVVQFCEVAHHVAVDQMGPN